MHPETFFLRSTVASWRFSIALYFSISSWPVAVSGASTRGDAPSTEPSGGHAFLPAAQTLDPCLHLRVRPVLEQPCRQRVVAPADRERLVLVGAALGEQVQRMREFVIDLERVAVGIGE